MVRKSIVAATLLAAGATLPAAARAGTTAYQITGLGMLEDGFGSWAFGINDAGQVVGQSNHNVGAYSYPQAFLYDHGTTTNLGNLGGSNTSAVAVNSAGLAVGSGSTPGNGSTHAFLYSGGSMTDLTALAGGSYGYASDVNDAGVVVGNLDSKAFIYSAGTFTDLGPLVGVNSSAVAVNQSGTVAVNTSPSPGVFTSSTYDQGVLTPLGTLPGYVNTFASDINQSGAVVGYVMDSASLNAFSQAFLYQNGTATSLGTLDGLPSTATSINDAGVVVGWLDGPGFLGDSGFVWSDGVMTRLDDLISPDSGWQIERANAINNSGQIVGYGYHDGAFEAFLLTPVPEPALASWIGLAMLGACTSRRHRARG